jgi:purine-binding chemotaxis protein CheW
MTTTLVPATCDLVLPFCTFRLGEGLFGVLVSVVKEVSSVPPLTPVPHAPPTVLGYVNLRGQIHLALDLKRLLGLGSATLSPSSRLVLFKPALGDPFGVVADEIGPIVHLSTEQIEGAEGRASEGAGPPGANPEGGHPALVSGTGKLAGELVILLDARKFLPAVERALAAATS